MKFGQLIPPLALIAAILFFWLAESFGWLPSPQEILTVMSAELLNRGAYAIIFISFLENIVFLNTYFPGSIVILGVMATTYGDPYTALMVFAYITIGQISGLFVSERIGHKFFSNKMPNQAIGRIKLLSIGLFWHPHSASATALAFGVKKAKGRYLIIIGGCISWSIFWALIMYFGLGQIVKEVGWDYITLAVAFGWIAIELYRLRTSYKQ